MVTPIITAEFTTNHMGNLNLLLDMVDKAAQANASIIKMQCKDVDTFYSEEKLNSPYQSPYGKTYRDYRKIFEFDLPDFEKFDQKCKERDIPWFVTLQDTPSIEKMGQFDLPLYKVASVNSTNKTLLEKIAEEIPREKTLVISVAGRSLQDIEATVKTFPEHNLLILHCVAEYPCKPENLRLGNIPVLKQEFEDDRIKIGYSGHEEGIVPSLVAAHLGAHMIERHFTVSRYSFVHHIECSLEPDEFSEMASLIRANKNLEQYMDQLPEKALASSFQMSEMEESFLVKNTYGMDYVNAAAHL